MLIEEFMEAFIKPVPLTPCRSSNDTMPFLGPEPINLTKEERQFQAVVHHIRLCRMYLNYGKPDSNYILVNATLERLEAAKTRLLQLFYMKLEEEVASY